MTMLCLAMLEKKVLRPLTRITNAVAEAVVEELRAQGGQMHDMPHMGHPETFKRPNGDVADTAMSVFCGNLTQAYVPYEIDAPNEDGVVEIEEKVALCCIECDAMADWPRFAEAAAGA